MATSLGELLGTRYPIVQAPMAGGVTTPALVAECCEAGILGSIGAPYYSVSEIGEAAEAVRAKTSRPFAINLFVPLAPPGGDGARAREILNRFRAELGIPLDPAPYRPADSFDLQFEAVLRAKPAVFSFTMGVPDADRMKALRERGIVTIGTATTPEEGAALEEAGVDVVCAQGMEAGGHRGSFLVPTEEGLWGVLALVQALVRRVRVPVLAAGGIMDGRGIAAAMIAGASGAQLGTAFLACSEAGTAKVHRDALPTAHRTVLTKSFSGRHGRAIANRYTDAFEGVELPAFPGFLGETRDVRGAAARAMRADLMQLWAGQGAPLARAMPARALVETLVREMNQSYTASR